MYAPSPIGVFEYKNTKSGGVEARLLEVVGSAIVFPTDYNGKLVEAIHFVKKTKNRRSAEIMYIPEGVKTLEGLDFSLFAGLREVTIAGRAMTSIVGWSFYDCASLEKITLPDSITSVGDFAFYGCRSLVTLSLPKGVSSIGRHAFSGCSSLTKIDIPRGVTDIGIHAFDNTPNVTIHSKYGSYAERYARENGISFVGSYF